MKLATTRREEKESNIFPFFTAMVEGKFFNINLAQRCQMLGRAS